MVQSSLRVRRGAVSANHASTHAARPSGRRLRGVSLVEILVALVVFALGLIAAANALQRGVTSVSEKTGARIADLVATSAPPAARPPALPPARESGARPAAPEPEQAADDGGGFWGDAWDFTKKAGGFVLDNFTPVGDIKTLFDPNASVFDKVLAGTSLVASVVPIPGVGPGVKGLTKLVKFGAKHADDVKTIERGVDVARDVDRSRDAARTVDDVDPPDVAARRREPDEPEADCAGGSCRRKGSCFATGTLVFTEYGDRPIDSVLPGDRVWSRDAVTGELALKTVTQTFTRDSYVIDLHVAGAGGIDRLAVTTNHPFWVEGAGWLPAGTLADGAALWSPAGALIANATASLGGRTTVYNLEVADSHTYFVGTLHSWVHNESDDECPVAKDDEPEAPKGSAEFSDEKERAIAEFLEGEGKSVRPNPQEGVSGAGRQGDAYVDDVKTEFKSLDPDAAPNTIKNTVNDSLRREGQARDIVIDARNSGLTLEQAQQGAGKALGISRGKLDNLTIIGDGYSFTWQPRSP